MKILDSPLTLQEIKDGLDKEGFITGVIRYDFDDALSGDRDVFMDEICEKLMGSIMLENLSWKVVGFEDENILLLEVSGDPSEYISENEE